MNTAGLKVMLSLGDTAGAKSIVLRNPERVASFPFPEGQTDIDTWEDLEKLRDRAKKLTDLSPPNAQLPITVEN